MDENFSIKEILADVRDDIKQTHDTLIVHMSKEEAQLDSIINEQKKTNGRVTRLEHDYSELNSMVNTNGAKIAVYATIASFIVAAILTRLLDKFL